MTGTERIRELARDWLGLVGAADRDFVVSPVGLWLALGAVASGARGETGGELRGLLGVDGGAAAEAVTRVGRRLSDGDGVAVATGVWSRLSVLDAFRRGLPDVSFGLLPGPGEVSRGAQAALDAWVRRATGGRIGSLPLVLDGSEDLVLLNALALKAAWARPFPAQLTHDEPFTDAHGVTRPEPTMRQRIPVRQVWYVDGVTVVELPCKGKGGDAVRVRCALGPEGAGPAEVLPAAWAGPGERRPVAADAVDLALPRFGLWTRIDAHAQVAALGVRRALRPGADFSGICAADLHVSKVVQEALVEIAEEGVEAAAATAVTMTRSAAPRPLAIERVAFDRPFGVAVLAGADDLPLFVGWRAGTGSRI
ncbi:serpin family protein [Streptomyces sp. NPDC057411]|uniref:serpin family protein n=1 Tax=unclassified Streptomyces TaxID=2593676 RepID=UPI003626386E